MRRRRTGRGSGRYYARLVHDLRVVNGPPPTGRAAFAEMLRHEYLGPWMDWLHETIDWSFVFMGPPINVGTPPKPVAEARERRIAASARNRKRKIRGLANWEPRTKPQLVYAG